MKVFDFDNTLYFGESSVDFALFMIRNNKKIILWLPSIFWNLLKYKCCLVNKDKMEDTVNDFLKVMIKDKKELLEMTEKFWKIHRKKLDTALIKEITPDDAIITAGPSFLLDMIKSELGTSNLLCSEVDLDKKRVAYLNFSDNKVKRYKECYGDNMIDCFYTDSYNDRAMMDISETVFLVTKGKIKRIK